MTYNLTISQKPGYLDAVVTGPNTGENVTRYLEDLRTECAARGCFRALMEERLKGARLQAMDVFDIVSQGSDRARGKIQAFAYVDVNAEGDLMHFAETVALNRGLPVALFPTVADAERWLLRGDGKGT